ncbi:hypothetical protein VNI00_014357 [Paramarasmius palmivorus]|uniref:F-box domain-containing protein n=1 Tax=Paramarasmius palmivorus TaxID=297713 RepID=A0AAW0BTE4_9AGAR
MSPDLSGPLDTVSDDPDANLSSLSEVLSQWSTHSLAQFLADHIEYLDNGEETIQLDASQISKLEVAMLILYGRHLKLQAVVGRLPPEILAIIFSFVCGTNNVYPDIMPYIIRLSLVCQRWRNVVFSTPSLWSSLSFDFEEWRLDLERLERIVLMFLAQSKLSPLSLDLDVVCDKVISPGKKASKACLQILATIVQHSHRWQTVELRISPDGLKHPVFHPIIGRLPNLRVLRLTGVEAHDMIGRNPKIFENNTLFLGCPFLEHAAIDRLMIEDGIALPWRQIRTLELNAIRHEEMFRSTLASCTNIEDLRLDDLDFQLIDFTTLRLPRLKHLAISSKYISTDLAPIFHCLDLPGLVSMDIAGGY